MEDPEIRRRLRGFEAVWRRVRGNQEENASAMTRDLPLMPRRHGGPCRRRCRSDPGGNNS